MARDFDATDDSLENEATSDQSASTDAVIWAWVRLDGYGENSYGMISQYGADDWSTDGYITHQMYVKSTDATWAAAFKYQVPGGTPAHLKTAAAATNSVSELGKWYFLAVWAEYTKADDSVKLYQGDLDTEPTAGNTGGDAGATTDRSVVCDRLYIGRGDRQSNFVFDGQIGEVGIYTPSSPTQADVEEYLRQRWRGVDPGASDLFVWYPNNSGVDSGTTNIEDDHGPNGYDLDTTSDSTRPSPVDGPPVAQLRRFGVPL